MKIVVVGAGIAGLTAAWELTRAGGGADVIALESERRAGGVIRTETVDGFVVEGGPDGFLASEPELPALAQELGIGDRVVSQQARGTSIWTGKELQPIDEGRAATLLGIDARRDEVSEGFKSFAAGMAEPVVALTQRLHGVIRFAQGVAGLTRAGSRWRLAITGGSAHHADAVVLAVPAYRAGRLLEAVGVKHARALEEVLYAASITVSLAYRAEQVTGRLDGTGFVVDPGASGDHAAPLQLRACTYTSQKFPGRAPVGHILVRAFLSFGDGDPGTAAHTQLAPILGIRSNPLWSRTFYWSRGLPRYRGAHRQQVDDVRHRLKRLPPLAIAGAGYDGAGVSACVRSGRTAAAETMKRL